MTSNQARARQPIGAPHSTGGQFTAASRPAAQGTLTDPSPAPISIPSLLGEFGSIVGARREIAGLDARLECAEIVEAVHQEQPEAAEEMATIVMRVEDDGDGAYTWCTPVDADGEECGEGFAMGEFTRLPDEFGVPDEDEQIFVLDVAAVRSHDFHADARRVRLRMGLELLREAQAVGDVAAFAVHDRASAVSAVDQVPLVDRLSEEGRAEAIDRVYADPRAPRAIADAQETAVGVAHQVVADLLAGPASGKAPDPRTP